MKPCKYQKKAWVNSLKSGSGENFPNYSENPEAIRT